MDRFTAAEVETIKRFFGWIADGGWREDYNEGLTATTDDGIIVTEYMAASDYGGCSLDREDKLIPWIALTDPEEYARQEEEAKADQRRQREAARVENARRLEAEERSAFERLKAKFGQ